MGNIWQACKSAGPLGPTFYETEFSYNGMSTQIPFSLTARVQVASSKTHSYVFHSHRHAYSTKV